MTYLDRISQLELNITHSINHSTPISLIEVMEWNNIIGRVTYGDKHLDDEYNGSIFDCKIGGYYENLG